MLGKIFDILEHPVTPIGSFILMMVVDGVLHRAGMFGFSTVCMVILLIAMVISTLLNYSGYGTFMRRTCLVLCALSALVIYSEADWSGNEPAETLNTGENLYSYSDHYDVSFTGRNDKDDSPNGNTKSCYTCNGSQKCHVCRGKGYRYCSGTCVSGQCRSCKGTGVYDHGSYVSQCRVCHGDGLCDICKGTNLVECSICHGDGRCNQCR